MRPERTPGAQCSLLYKHLISYALNFFVSNFIDFFDIEYLLIVLIFQWFQHLFHSLHIFANY